MKYYGCLQNRLEENRMYCDEIKVGTGVTEYGYSDRHAYEVIDVRDQKHCTIRRLDHKHIGDGTMDNNWELISNEDNPTYELTKRGNYWYFTVTVHADDFKGKENDIESRLWLCHQGIAIDDLMQKGKITKYHRANLSFGHAEYYFDYSF